MIKTTYTIEINEEWEDPEDVAMALKRVAGMIEEGYSSGYYPTWNMHRKEEEVTE